MYLRTIPAILTASFLLTGCALAGLAVEGEIAALEGLGDVAAASRLAPLGVAAGRGVLAEALADMTAGGTETAVVSIDQAGLIRLGTRQLAEVESAGQIVANGTRVGFIRDGYIYDASGAGERAVAELHGFIPSRGVEIASNGAVRILRPNVFVDVLQVNQDQYLVRLADGETVWIDPAFAVLFIMGMNHPIPICPSGSGVIVRQSGELVLFDQCTQRDGAFIVQTYDGSAIVDGNDVKMIINDAAQSAMSSTAISLTGDEVVYGFLERNSDITRIATDKGSIVADNLRIEPHQPSLERISESIRSDAYTSASDFPDAPAERPVRFACWGCGHVQVPEALQRFWTPFGQLEHHWDGASQTQNWSHQEPPTQRDPSYHDNSRFNGREHWRDRHPDARTAPYERSPWRAREHNPERHTPQFGRPPWSSHQFRPDTRTQQFERSPLRPHRFQPERRMQPWGRREYDGSRQTPHYGNRSPRH